jgi:hypothetical protein
MPIDPTELTKSIGALGTLDPEQDLAPTLQQIVLAAKQLFEADAAGLMLIDQQGQLRWASASDQTAQTIEDGQERLAQGPCMVAFSQRAPAAIRDVSRESEWAELGQVLMGEGISAALSAPVELDGSAIGTLDIYSSVPWGLGRQRDRHPADLCRAGGQPPRRGRDRPGPGPPGQPVAGRPGASVADRAGQGHGDGPRTPGRPGRL